MGLCDTIHAPRHCLMQRPDMTNDGYRAAPFARRLRNPTASTSALSARLCRDRAAWELHSRELRRLRAAASFATHLPITHATDLFWLAGTLSGTGAPGDNPDRF